MLKKLKNYFLTLRAQKATHESKVARQLVSYDRAKNIGMLFGSHFEGRDAQVINQFVKRLREEGKNVKSLTYFAQERSVPFDFKYDFFTEKELGMLGEFKSDAVDRFVNTEFDYLYCIHNSAFLPFTYILGLSKARFRIGIYQEELSDFFEFMINPVEGQDLANVVDEMMNYLRRLSEHHPNPETEEK